MMTVQEYCCMSLFFFFNDTATTEIYTLSLHDALPISRARPSHAGCWGRTARCPRPHRDRKSTRLNSSHLVISYAVFCLKKKNKLDHSMLFSSCSDLTFVYSHSTCCCASTPATVPLLFS